jgi:hypothetical protein
MHDIAQKQIFFKKLPKLEPDPDLVVKFPDLDPDPAKTSGSDWIRIRNTVPYCSYIYIYIYICIFIYIHTHT